MYNAHSNQYSLSSLSFFGLVLGLLFLSASLSSCKSAQSATKSPTASSPSRLDELSIDKEKIDQRFVDACTHMIRGDYRVAIDMFKEVLEMMPDHHASMYNIAKLSMEQRQYEEAVQYASRALDADKSNYWYYQILKQAYEFKGEYPKAIEVQEEIVKQFPSRIEDQIQLAELYIRNRDMESAISTLTKLEAETGSNEEISLRKFQIFMRQKQYELALNTVNTLVDAHPQETRFYQMKYEVLDKLNRQEEGVATLEELLERDSDNGFALLSLADYYKGINDAEKSDFYLFRAFQNPEIDQTGKIEIIQNLLRLVPNNPNMFPRVQQLSSIFNETHPGSAQAYALQGKLFFMDSNIDSARIFYKKSLDIESSNIPVWLDLIETSFGTRDFHQLYKDTEEALEFYPNQEQFLYFLGISGSQIGEYPAAINALEKIKRIGTAGKDLMAQACAELGQLYHFEQKFDKSDENFDRALSYLPDDAGILNNYAYYLSERSSRLEEAQQMSEKALKAEPNQASYLDTYGWIFYRQGRYTEAEKWIKKAVEINPDVDILEHHGDVLYKLGKKEEAKAQWQRAIEAGASINIEQKMTQQ